MNGRVLIIPCETQAREFDAKLLLSCFAAEQGFRVIVGSKKEINKRIGSLRRWCMNCGSEAIRARVLATRGVDGPRSRHELESTSQVQDEIPSEQLV